MIGGKVLIRAPFHGSSDDLPCTLIIEPKMSFGTGHHHTTRLMIIEMMKHELEGRRVLDMGCGTGVLGIYACKLGAARVLGVDIDQWAYENALENIKKNGVFNGIFNNACRYSECFDWIVYEIESSGYYC